MTIKQKIFIWLGTRLFNYIDVYQPKEGGGMVIAITFSLSKSYINKVAKIK